VNPRCLSRFAWRSDGGLNSSLKTEAEHGYKKELLWVVGWYETFTERLYIFISAACSGCYHTKAACPSAWSCRLGRPQPRKACHQRQCDLLPRMSPERVKYKVINSTRLIAASLPRLGISSSCRLCSALRDGTETSSTLRRWSSARRTVVMSELVWPSVVFCTRSETMKLFA